MKRQRTLLTLGLIFTAFAAVSFSGCSSKSKKADDTVIPSAVDPEETIYGDSDSNNALGLQTITFAYDSYALSPAAETKLKDNAAVLSSNPKMTIQIEGHCDERGSIQYNLALGENRANSVRKRLADLGVSGDRMTVISYGKERPLNPASNEEAWAQNRRANFVITSR